MNKDGEESNGAEKKNESQEFNQSIMSGEDLRIWKKYLSKNGRHEEKGYDHSLMKRVGGVLKKKGVIFLENSSKLKVHNHFQCNYFLGNKKALFYSLRKYYELLGEDPFSKIPLTFHITQGIQDP